MAAASQLMCMYGACFSGGEIVMLYDDTTCAVTGLRWSISGSRPFAVKLKHNTASLLNASALISTAGSILIAGYSLSNIQSLGSWWPG